MIMATGRSWNNTPFFNCDCIVSVVSSILSQSSLLTRVVAICLLISSPWLILQIGIVAFAPDQEFTEMPTCSSSSGNCAHLGGGDDYRLLENLPTVVNLTVSEAYGNLISYVDNNGLKIIYEDSNEDSHYLHFVEKTPFWQFPDDVVVSLQDNDSTTIVEIHSESRIGWGDLGVNPERIEKIYSSLIVAE